MRSWLSRLLGTGEVPRRARSFGATQVTQGNSHKTWARLPGMPSSGPVRIVRSIASSARSAIRSLPRKLRSVCCNWSRACCGSGTRQVVRIDVGAVMRTRPATQSLDATLIAASAFSIPRMTSRASGSRRSPSSVSETAWVERLSSRIVLACSSLLIVLGTSGSSCRGNARPLRRTPPQRRPGSMSAGSLSG